MGNKEVRAMRLFVAAVVVIMSSTVFAGDVVWEVAPPFSLMPGSSSQEGGKAPKDDVADENEKKNQAQSSQQNAGDVPLTSTEQPPDANKDPNQHSTGNVKPTEVTQDVWDTSSLTLGTIGTTVAIVAGVLAICDFFIRLYLRNKTARDEQRREHPALLAENWRPELHANTNPIGFGCRLRNTGRAATITQGSLNFIVSAVLPPSPDWGNLPANYKRRFTVFARETLTYTFPVPTERWNQYKVSGGERLYAYGYISYTDEFDEFEDCYCLRFFLYEKSGEFIPIGGEDYNCTKTCKKKRPLYKRLFFRNKK